MKRVEIGVGTVFRYEGVLDDDVLATGAAEPHDAPIVVDCVIRTRQQKGAGIGRAAWLARWRDASEDDPLAEVAAAGK